MNHNYKKNERKNFSILVDERELLDFNTFLLKYFNTIEFAGKTNDNTELKFDSINDVLDYPNHKERKLESIEVSCKECIDDEKARLTISLGSQYTSFPESIQYYFRYNNIDWGFRFDDELTKHLREFKTWYALPLPPKFGPKFKVEIS